MLQLTKVILSLFGCHYWWRTEMDWSCKPCA